MLAKLGIEGNYLPEKPRVNIILYGRRSNASPPKIGNRQGCLPSTPSQHHARNPS